jgi:DNA-binding NtrC family response regulator
VTRTLVIDDEPFIRSLLHTILTKAGHQVFEAADGSSAMRLLDAQPIDLVFCDLVMPGMNGLETIPRVRRVHPTVRIVAMSGGGHFGGIDVLDSLLPPGAAVKMAKPFAIERVLAAAAEALAAG